MKHTPKTPSLKGIRITDELFGRYVRMVAEQLIPYQWEALNDRVDGAEKSWCIRNFRIAAGESRGEHKGFVFGDTDLYKWIETLAFCLEADYAREYEPIADEAIELIGRAQCEDGYINTYYTIQCPERRWTNFTEGHELYSAGHFFEAAAAYYTATGKRRILDIACQFADLLCDVFTEEGPLAMVCPGHPEVELALIKLADVTGVHRYAELARHFLLVRGKEPEFFLKNLAEQGKYRIFPEFDAYDPPYAQAHVPTTEQTTAEGHAVRAVYLYSAMADVARVFSDPAMEKACSALWENVTEKRMYLTGGIGSSGLLERFTTDYDLPNDRMYCESCASVGLMMFGKRMAELTGEAKYYDAVEKALCNTVLAGISAEGDRYFYVNPLEVWPDNCLPSTSMAHVRPVRQPWFSPACCPPNIARTLASVGQYIYAQDTKSVYIHQFISSELKTVINGSEVQLSILAEAVPGRISISVSNPYAQAFTLRIRIPHWLTGAHFSFDGKEITPVTEAGYAVIAVSRAGSQKLEITADVKPRFVAANTRARADVGKIAVMFGPYVYCLEEEDNEPNLPALCVSPDSCICCDAPEKDLPGNLPVLRFSGSRLESFEGDALYSAPAFHYSEKTLRAVPYALWGNRHPGEMLVWLRAKL